jgi:hypothetical protein
VAAAEALHQGDPQPMSDLLARRDPVSLFPGMADHRTGRDAVTAVFLAIAPKFSNTTPLSFELVSADVQRRPGLHGRLRALGRVDRRRPGGPQRPPGHAYLPAGRRRVAARAPARRRRAAHRLSTGYRAGPFRGVI